MLSHAERKGSYVASQLSINTSTSSLSMEDGPEPPSGTPPDYEAVVQAPQLRQRFNVQPREDEGCEALPPYSSAISIENVFMRKMELEGAVHRANDRNWHRVCVMLQGTALTFHKYKGKGIFGPLESVRSDACHSSPSGTVKGAFLKSYNLQHAEVGIAADYYKKRYVIRIRAETDQFLISCLTIETFVLWLQSLFAAIDLAPPLDDREIPRDLSIPRPRRRRQQCVRYSSDMRTEADILRNAALVREQYEIIRLHFPGLATAVNEPYAPVSEETLRETLSSLQDVGLTITTPPRQPHLPPTRMASVPTLPRSSPRATFNERRPSTAPAPARPSLDPETGKWQPEHEWSATYDMIYAKRCMAILTSKSPRKSNYVIVEGKQWVVDWVTGALTRVCPPDYTEGEAGMGGDLNGVGNYGSLVRV